MEMARRWYEDCRSRGWEGAGCNGDIEVVGGGAGGAGVGTEVPVMECWAGGESDGVPMPVMQCQRWGADAGGAEAGMRMLVL